MRTVTFATAADLGRAVALDIRDGLNEARRRDRVWTLGLPSGRSCVPVLDALEGLDHLDLTYLRVLMPDAYCVERDGEELSLCPPDAPHSVFEFLRLKFPRFWKEIGETSLSDRVLVPDPRELGRLEMQLGPGTVDLMVLASGSGDGHVAFNTPGSLLGSRTRVVRLPPSTRQDNLKTYPHFGHVENVPRIGVTIGIHEISTWSRRAVIILSGAEKRRALHRILATHGYDEAWPASVIHECEFGRIYTDIEARG